jgi:hypothetical protein
MLSTTIACPRLAVIFSPRTRASVSVALPAENGTTNLIGRLG